MSFRLGLDGAASCAGGCFRFDTMGGLVAPERLACAAAKDADPPPSPPPRYVSAGEQWRAAGGGTRGFTAPPPPPLHAAETPRGASGGTTDTFASGTPPQQQRYDPVYATEAPAFGQVPRLSSTSAATDASFGGGGGAEPDDAAGGGGLPVVVLVIVLLAVAVVAAVVALRKAAPLGVLPSWLVDGPCGRAVLPGTALARPTRSQARATAKLAKEEEGEELLWQQLARKPAARVAAEMEEEDDLD